MKAVITVVGKDSVGLVAKVSSVCADKNANVTEVSQSILGDIFAMFMMVEIDKITCDFSVLVDLLKALGKTQNMKIHVMHEEVFQYVHNI